MENNALSFDNDKFTESEKIDFIKNMYGFDEIEAAEFLIAYRKADGQGIVDGVVGTVDSIINIDETIKTLAYVASHPGETFDQVVLSIDDWNTTLAYAVKHDPKLAGEMLGYVDGNLTGIPGSGIVVGGTFAKSIQKVAQTVKNSPDLITNFAIKVSDKINANSKLPTVGKTIGYENQKSIISTGAENVALYPKL
ncbi:hypothetical protein FHQ30_13090, partial [Pasteurellaceae bacterium Phil11]